MFGTHSVVMWKNEDGTTTMSQRYAMSYKEPRPVDDPPRVAKVVEPISKIRPSRTTTLAFQIPANQSLLASADATEHLIYAFSPFTPDKDPAAHIAHHQHAGYFTLDLNKDFKLAPQLLAGAPPKTPEVMTGTNVLSRNEKLMVIHALFVSLGFLVLLPLGSLIARYGRPFVPGPKWFKAHWVANMGVAGPIITLGVLLGPVIVYNKQTYRSHFMNAHEVCGVLLLILYWGQVMLGRYIHERRNHLAAKGPITRPHPPLNIVHIVLGTSIIALSFFQVRSGLEWWEKLTGRGPLTSWAIPLWKTWAVVLPLAYFGGYALLPRQLRQEREAAYAPIPADLQAQHTHLLRAEDEDP